jgi:hypothetical protein
MTRTTSVQRTQKAYEQTCRANLLAIYEEIAKFERERQTPPNSLVDLVALQRDQLVCPFTNDIAANGEVSYIYVPETYGTDRIMVYSRSVVEQDYGFSVSGNGIVRNIRMADLH